MEGVHMSSGWKQRERLVASWFGTYRTPLSGRNNRNDDGSKRLGDILYRHALIEVKRRKSIGMKLAKETRALAKEHGIPWLHIEFSTGEADLVRIVTNFTMAALMCNLLSAKLEETDGMERRKQ